MSDKSWMLNHEAINHAKDCIDIVKTELDIKLKLSHPDFIPLLHVYVDILHSNELNMAYSRLIAMAGPGTIINSLPDRNQKVVALQLKRAVGR